MYAGRVVEEANVNEFFSGSTHPYTWGLPRPPTGCQFITRCPHKMPICETEPELRIPDPAAGHPDRCHIELAAKRELRLVDGAIGLPIISESAIA
jgi:ABC-type dipeptide/oligopeptide/nickel transport system ATPase component